ncbi:jg2183 [Pararge aegeria aegeria]|uniref:Jg2183 protein n=1 Tax=Pararge aegeria aegeria TaxID=348720 RepID=A0A8S4RWJ2_9NEOP|nr:jg2183 [Pararge aegeria aegeria]
MSPHRPEVFIKGAGGPTRAASPVFSAADWISGKDVSAAPPPPNSKIHNSFISSTPHRSTSEMSSLSVCSDFTTGSEGRFYREEAGKKLSSCSFPISTIYILHLKHHVLAKRNDGLDSPVTASHGLDYGYQGEDLPHFYHKY